MQEMLWMEQVADGQSRRRNGEVEAKPEEGSLKRAGKNKGIENIKESPEKWKIETELLHLDNKRSCSERVKEMNKYLRKQ